MPLTDDFDWWERFRASDAYKRLQTRPVAYFCAEFALTGNLKTYSGGLGILAGDILREASDQKFPLVGVGLLYGRALQKSQLTSAEISSNQIMDKSDKSDSDSADLSAIRSGPPQAGQADASRFEPTFPDPSAFGLESVLAAGSPLTVRVPLQDRYVTVAAYRWPAAKLGSGWWSGGVRTAPVYLLTTDCPGNDPRDCCIIDQLYPPDKEKRLQQEIILGLGGLRLLEALGIHPSIYHLNEGHSAFLALEIIRHEMSERMISFDDALQLARRHVVFTNHTLVPAGQDIFSNDLVAANLAKYAEELAAPVDRLVQLGLVQESSLFSMTMLSLRLAGKTNAVSQIHAQKAAQIWADHPMIGITNGIHRGMWDRLQNWEVRGEKLDQDMRSEKSNFSLQNPASHFPLPTSTITTAQDIWTAHIGNKQLLLKKIQASIGQSWPDDCLLLGWARRFVGYKRPLAPFFDPVWLKAICTRPDRPVRIVISGNVQEGDAEGEKLLTELKTILNSFQNSSESGGASGDPIERPQPVKRVGEDVGWGAAKRQDPNHGKSFETNSSIAIYLPNYDLELAQLLTAGCDVWLNTPVVGFEACGTSGMKACLNGVLPISTKDGWMAEIDPIGIGWIIDSDKVSDSLYQTLEHQIIPLYFEHRDEWLKNMASARRLILENFTTTRTLKEYVENLYLIT